MCEHEWVKIGKAIYKDGLYQRYRCKRCGAFRKGECVEEFERKPLIW